MIAQAVIFLQFHTTITQLKIIYPQKTDLLPRRQSWTLFHPTPVCKANSGGAYWEEFILLLEQNTASQP